MKHFCICPDYESWRAWTVENGVDGRIIGYLAFDNSRLCAEPGPSDLAYPTPRSWNFVSENPQTMACDPAQIHDLISANVGADAALEFENWCKVYQELPSVSEPIPFETVEELMDVKPVGGGGTSFRRIFGYLRENMEDELPKLILILTDGCAPFPKEEDALDVDVIWVIIDSDVEPPWGNCVHIDL